MKIKTGVFWLFLNVFSFYENGFVDESGRFDICLGLAGNG
jgi:hypothetical protein